MSNLEAARTILAHLPDRHRALGNVISAQSGNGGGGERVATSKVEAPSIVNEDAVEARRFIEDTLDRWASLLLRRNGFDPRPIGRNPAVTAAIIVAGWRHIYYDETADYIEFPYEILKAASLADRVLDPPTPQPIGDRLHDNLVDTNEVARLARVSPGRVRQWTQAGDLTAVERGRNGRNLYDIAAVRTFIRQRTTFWIDSAPQIVAANTDNPDRT